MASATVRPKPSRVDFCSTTAARRCRAQCRIVYQYDSDSFLRASAQGIVDLLAFRIIGCNIADENECTVNLLARHSKGVDDALRVFPVTEIYKKKWAPLSPRLTIVVVG